MNGQQTSIAQDLESLFRKMVTANQQFLSESTSFVKNMNSTTIKGEDFAAVQKELFTDAFNQFVKLNIQHASNLVDLGVALSQKFGGLFDTKQDASPPTATAGDQDDQAATRVGKPAFTLDVTGISDSTVTTQFLLDSDKKDPVICQLVHTGFINQQDVALTAAFETVFSPQSFQLLSGEAQKVTISIKIPADAKEGVYLSNVRVEGFENTFFSLYVRVAPSDDPNNKMSA